MAVVLAVVPHAAYTAQADPEGVPPAAGVVVVDAQPDGINRKYLLEAVAFAAQTSNPIRPNYIPNISSICFVPKQQAEEAIKNGVKTLHGFQCANDACAESLTFHTALKTPLGVEKATSRNIALALRQIYPEESVRTIAPIHARTPAKYDCPDSKSPRYAPQAPSWIQSPISNFPNSCVYDPKQTAIKIKPCNVQHGK